MPRCLLVVEGADHDITNLLTEKSLCEYLSRCQLQQQRQQQPEEPSRDSTITLHEILRQHEQYQVSLRQQARRQHDWGVPLYPNLRDPCNRRMIQEVPRAKWEAVPLVRQIDASTSTTSREEADKFAEFYDLQQRDLERLQQEHFTHQTQQQEQQADMTSLPQRAFSAPLHTRAGALAPHSPTDGMSMSMPSFQAQQTMAHFPSRYGDNGFGTNSLTSPSRRPSPPRQAGLPPVRRHRHSTTAVPRDIESSSSGLRPRVNYKALYTARRSSSSSSRLSGSSTPPVLETSISGYSACGSDIMEEESSTMMGSSRRSLLDDHHPLMDDEEPVEESEQSQPRTMEIAPSVHVQVRSSQETYKAVQSGDYTVATCFACCATIVCVNDAAYVLCPDCQVVSPLGYGGTTPSSADSSKKDDPYGIGTGLKREWVNEHVS